MEYFSTLIRYINPIELNKINYLWNLGVLCCIDLIDYKLFMVSLRIARCNSFVSPNKLFIKISLGSLPLYIPGMVAPPHPAPPRGKTGCPAPQKAGLAPPRPAPQNWQIPRGAAGQNWLQIPLMAPFHYAYKLCIRGRKSRKIFSFDFVYRLWLSCSQKYLF